jgi:hypothetical protein
MLGAEKKEMLSPEGTYNKIILESLGSKKSEEAPDARDVSEIINITIERIVETSGEEKVVLKNIRLRLSEYKKIINPQS